MSRTHRYRGLSLMVAAAAALAVAAGCSQSSTGPSDSAEASGDAANVSPGGSASAAAGPAGIWQQFVTCARGAGQANWPDAQVAADGQATFPENGGFDLKNGYDAVREQCGPILVALPPQVNPYRELTQSQIEAVRRYVECLHQHGMTDVPAPDSNGRFREPDKYRQPQHQEIRNTARDACDHILLEAKE